MAQHCEMPLGEELFLQCSLTSLLPLCIFFPQFPPKLRLSSGQDPGSDLRLARSINNRIYRSLMVL